MTALIPQLAPVIAAAKPIDSIHEVIRLTNAYRTFHGRTELRSAPNLHISATNHARYIVKTGKFSHDGWAGFIRRTKYRFLHGYLGENIAMGQTTPAEVVHDWLASPGHRANIMGAHYVDTGVGRVNDVWVVHFGGK